jgi:hypothetical protein
VVQVEAEDPVVGSQHQQAELLGHAQRGPLVAAATQRGG